MSSDKGKMHSGWLALLLLAGAGLIIGVVLAIIYLPAQVEKKTTLAKPEPAPAVKPCGCQKKRLGVGNL